MFTFKSRCVRFFRSNRSGFGPTEMSAVSCDEPALESASIDQFCSSTMVYGYTYDLEPCITVRQEDAQ